MDKIIDPVHQDNIDKQWYFWDEVWAYKMGPYSSEEEAKAELFKYCRYLNMGVSPPECHGGVEIGSALISGGR